MPDRLLVLNAGSSSLKFGVYEVPADDADVVLLCRGQMAAIGAKPHFTATDAAGLQAGDIITEVSGRAVVEGRDIVVLLLPFRPGDTVPLTVLRGGEELVIEVTLGELPDNT